MFYVVRCPGCLLTIYCDFVDDGDTGPPILVWLDDERLAFYNCPHTLCDYHFSTNDPVNLYANQVAGRVRHVSPFLTIAPRNPNTTAFRPQGHHTADLLALALVDLVQSEQQELHDPAAQASNEARTANDEDEDKQHEEEQNEEEQNEEEQNEEEQNEEEQGEEDDEASDNKHRKPRWTAAEVEQLKRLLEEGQSYSDIAKAIGRSSSSIGSKIILMRRRGDLPKVGQPTAQE